MPSVEDLLDGRLGVPPPWEHLFKAQIKPRPNIIQSSFEDK